MSETPAIVLLAAGIGRRFGGLKQLTPVGPSGEAILDYTVYDARRAGLRHVVFVIRDEIEAEMRAFVAARYPPELHVDLVSQRLDACPDGVAIPPARIKPWGTGHAVLAAAARVSGDFIVANADDYYGVSAVDALARFLAVPGDDYGLVTYTMRQTLVADAPVSRAFCLVNAAGMLESIEELTSLASAGQGAIARSETGVERHFSGDEPVSMNLWGFRADVLDHLQTGFRAFFERGADLVSDEYFLPDCINALVAASRKRVCALPAGDSRWCGMTHPADRARVADAIRKLIDQGVYPERLWS